MQVVVDGVVTNYVSHGSGSVMLCLHGWGSNIEAFRNFPKYFSKYRVIALDLPGFGASERPNEAWGLADYATFVAHFLQKIKVSEVGVIVAHSNGSAIAIKGIATRVLSTEKLVILGGAGIRTVRKGKKKFLKTISSAGKPLLYALPSNLREKVRKNWYESIGSEMLLVPGMEGTFKKVVSEDMIPLVREISIPVLLIYGEHDQSTPPLYGQLFFENFPDAQLEIIGGAGHYVHIDQETKVMGLIKDFL